MKRRSHPRSPVQHARNPWWAPFLLAFMLAGVIWTWQQWQIQSDELEKPTGPVAEHAKANLMLLFSTDDYPIKAIQNEEQGTVAFKLTIDRRGRINRCDIIGSSGSEALDEATCKILERRARFVPAKDSAGNAVPDEFSSRIRWELPEE